MIADEGRIAVIGMAGIYPRAGNLADLLRHLREGGSGIGRPPADRWSWEAFFDPDPAAEDRSTSRALAVIDDPEIDLSRFGIPPAQAGSIARIQRLFLEVVDRCFADAGYDRREFARETTDVICGCCFGSDRAYANALRVEAMRFVARFTESLRELSPHLGGEAVAASGQALKDHYRRRFGGSAHDRIGEMASTIPARIALARKLRGRCLTVESADATSFVALRIAVENLRRREASLAVCAVGQVFDSPLLPIAFSKKGYLAPDDSIPLSRDARGYVLGEGVGALLLKRLDDAVRDGDRVHCVIGGVGLTQTSRPGSFRYSPSVRERSGAVREACLQAGWDPASLQYIECFGSQLAGEGELEIDALADALSSSGVSRQSVLIGCVKELIGHGFAVSGLSAITKVALGLRERTLFPQARLREPDTMDLSRTPFVVVRKLRPWPDNADGLPRRAGVNGLSMTGTCAHVVLEEYQPEPRSTRVVVASSPRVEKNHPPVAVVGLGGRFASAPSARRFWQNIREKLDTIAPLPDSVVEREVYYGPGEIDAFKTYSIAGSKVDEPQLGFERYRIPPRRLLYMDVAQKLALAAAGEAFEMFGHPARPLPTRRTAVVMASTLCLNGERAANTRIQYELLEEALTGSRAFAELGRVARARLLDHLRRTIRDPAPPVSPGSLDGFLASGVSAAISNEFGLNAVPVAVEAACASSLAALDVAVRGLASGEFDFVVTGGVELPANARDLVICSGLRLLSTDRITPFSERADGFSVGEGIALFVLKRLEDARADGDRIYAVLRAVGASNDARSLVAPDDAGQALAMRRAFAQVDFAPSSVQYLEAHGTGTTVGDQIEAKAISAVYRDEARPSPLAIGSVKSMIGHTFAAAGAAGLLKTIFALDEKILPANIHLDPINPKLGLEEIPAYVNTETRAWPASPTGPRRAAVSSMGTGGINYHLLLEEAPPAP